MPPINPCKVKFHSSIPNSSLLFYAVSKNNLRQTGDNFKLIVSWIIENKGKISELKIILSDWLHRHYVGEKQALLWGIEWENENKKYLDKFIKEGVQYQLINWKTVVKAEHYKQIKLNIDALYREDEGFIVIVKGLARSHQHKAGLEAAINYVLEESAGIASLEEGVLTYPAQALNGVVHYALNKLNCGPRFIGHMLVPLKPCYNPQENLFQAAFKVMCALDQANYKSSKDKMGFFKQVIETYETANKSRDGFLKNLSFNQDQALYFSNILFYKKEPKSETNESFNKDNFLIKRHSC